MTEHIKHRAMLITGGVSAILASTCCLGPLLLITLGFSGAWISNLALLEAYRPYFISAALLAIATAARNIWRPSRACKPGEACALPEANQAYKVLFWVVTLLVLLALGFPYAMPLFY